MILNFFRMTMPGRRRSAWNSQYRKGIWNYLNDSLEIERYESVLKMLRKYAYKGSLFEVGCGEGILQSRMRTKNYSCYLGIDISEIAIKKAARFANKNTIYRRADMEKYVPDKRFDVILFNESLYYAKAPVKILGKYARFLNPTGYIIISIFETVENRLLLDSIESTYPVVESAVSTNERGSWFCLAIPKESISG